MVGWVSELTECFSLVSDVGGESEMLLFFSLHPQEHSDVTQEMF